MDFTLFSNINCEVCINETLLSIILGKNVEVIINDLRGNRDRHPYDTPANGTPP